jgi:hypothetical protein
MPKPGVAVALLLSTAAALGTGRAVLALEAAAALRAAALPVPELGCFCSGALLLALRRSGPSVLRDSPLCRPGLLAAAAARPAAAAAARDAALAAVADSAGGGFSAGFLAAVDPATQPAALRGSLWARDAALGQAGSGSGASACCTSSSSLGAGGAAAAAAAGPLRLCGVTAGLYFSYVRCLRSRGGVAGLASGGGGLFMNDHTCSS